MNQQKRHQLAAILAIVLGLLSLKEGGGVLLGLATGPSVILPWLVWYNVVVGFLSVLAGRGMWLTRTWAVKLADTIVTLHGVVLMLLVVLYAFHEPVALTSVIATLFRTLVWVGIVLLLRWSVGDGMRGEVSSEVEGKQE